MLGNTKKILEFPKSIEHLVIEVEELLTSVDAILKRPKRGLGFESLEAARVGIPAVQAARNRWLEAMAHLSLAVAGAKSVLEAEKKRDG